MTPKEIKKVQTTSIEYDAYMYLYLYNYNIFTGKKVVKDESTRKIYY